MYPCLNMTVPHRMQNFFFFLFACGPSRLAKGFGKPCSAGHRQEVDTFSRWMGRFISAFPKCTIDLAVNYPANSTDLHSQKTEVFSGRWDPDEHSLDLDLRRAQALCSSPFIPIPSVERRGLLNFSCWLCRSAQVWNHEGTFCLSQVYQWSFLLNLCAHPDSVQWNVEIQVHFG